MTRLPLHRTAKFAEAALTFPARRPVTTLVAYGVILAIAAIGLTRLRANTSLSTMFPTDSPSAGAMIRVLDAFPASGELILLASVPPGTEDGNATPPTKLLAFAQRFEQAVAGSPDAKAITDGVIYRADPEYRRFAEKVVGPAGLYYLDDAAFAEARQRLTPEGMRQQIGRNEAMMAQPGPAAAAAAKEFSRDPLRLVEFILGRLAGRRQFKTWQNGDDFVSPDGRAVLIRVVGTKPASDLDYCERLVTTARTLAAGANTDGLTLDFTGAYAAADFSHHAIRKDSTESIVASILLLQVLFLVVYRRPFRQFLLELSPILVGVFVGFGLYGWLRGGLSPIAAVIGGILAGMAIDYSVLYLAAYFRHVAAGKSPVEAVRLTATQTVGAMAAAWFTSAIGFVAIGWSSVPTLQDFALLGTLSLASAFVTVVFVLPAVVTLWDVRRLARNDSPAARRFPFRWEVLSLLELIRRRRRTFIACSGRSRGR
jgi:predicted RND superfamily exporter protein